MEAYDGGKMDRERERQKESREALLNGREQGYKKLYIVVGTCMVPCPVWISINILTINLPLPALMSKSLISLAEIMGHITSLTALCQKDQC